MLSAVLIIASCIAAVMTAGIIRKVRKQGFRLSWGHAFRTGYKRDR